MTDNLDKVDDIVKKFRDEILNNPELKTLYKKELHKVEKFLGKVSNQETFSWGKFFKGLNIFNPVVLAKWIQTIVIIIVTLGIIFGIIYYLGYKQGTAHKPIKIILKDGKQNQEVYIKQLDGTYLHIYPNGYVWVEDDKGKKLKQICSEDIKGLQEELKPFGFELLPFAALGVGVGDTGLGIEGGLGIQWAHLWNLQFDSLITSGGIYPLGFTYSLKDLGLPNTSVGIAAGEGWSIFQGERDDRVLLYGKIKF